ncbi:MULTISPECIES: FAD binding domain-containing protein [Serratia]|uniref:FAD binding domain-containing protein n=1 Tax=Serratia TaxID=613 RepID=UPI001F4C2E9E|nr:MULTISPECIES: FAD binding domain-containing protein [Serratia]ULG11034.1 molybdopterin dehydrogenase FAD-binding [Serratia entomophila]CAI1954751.1 FAD binding domain in molybdopterin dehydrogenase [Serratia quinivorans]CAI2159044.1 FAD binding domain in molybdopterin dehydrogenase [Serratia quinivorans]
MKPSSFQYVAPDTLDDALRHLSGSDPAKILAVGQSFMPDLITLRVHCELLIDLNKIKALDSIMIDGKQVIMDVTVCHRDAERDHLLHQPHPLMIHMLHRSVPPHPKSTFPRVTQSLISPAGHSEP